MTVEQFVARRGERWRRLSELCDRIGDLGAGVLSGDDLTAFGDLYRLTASDLSYAATHLRHVELLGYLNRLVARAHGQLYARRERARFRPAGFLSDYPARWRQALPFVLVAAGLLLAGIVTGWVTVLADPRQATAFVPLEMVADMSPDRTGAIPAAAFVALSSVILTTNLSAALIAFAGGLLFGLGPVAALLKNGLLVGALAGLSQRVSTESLVTYAGLIAPHGVLELAALVTAGAAGLKLGWAIVAGGRVPRLDALRLAGRDSLALLLGCLPWFVVAAGIEAFLTPLPVSPAVKLLFAAVTAGALAAWLFGRTSNAAISVDLPGCFVSSS